MPKLRSAAPPPANAADLLKRSYHSLERDSAPGIDGVTWQTYGENLDEKPEDLHDKDAFDARGAPVLAVADMAGFAPEVWHDLKFMAHPSAIRLDLTTNVSAVWLAFKNDETPPDAVALEELCRPLIWRQDVIPLFPELSPEEAMMWDEAVRGIPFGVPCSMLATHDDARRRGGQRCRLSAQLGIGGTSDRSFWRQVRVGRISEDADRNSTEFVTWSGMTTRSWY